MKTIEDFITPAVLLYGSEYFDESHIYEVFNIAENMYAEYRSRFRSWGFKKSNREGLEKGRLQASCLGHIAYRVDFGEGEYPITAHFDEFGERWAWRFTEDGKREGTEEQLFVRRRGYEWD